MARGISSSFGLVREMSLVAVYHAGSLLPHLVATFPSSALLLTGTVIADR